MEPLFLLVLVYTFYEFLFVYLYSSQAGSQEMFTSLGQRSKKKREKDKSISDVDYVHREQRKDGF